MLNPIYVVILTELVSFVYKIQGVKACPDSPVKPSNPEVEKRPGASASCSCYQLLAVEAPHFLGIFRELDLL